MNLSNEMITNYCYMTEINAHGEVLEEIARDFKLTHYTKLFQAINTIHALEGHLSYDVLQVRDRLKLEMMDIFKANLNDLDYEELTFII